MWNSTVACRNDDRNVTIPNLDNTRANNPFCVFFFQAVFSIIVKQNEKVRNCVVYWFLFVHIDCKYCESKKETIVYYLAGRVKSIIKNRIIRIKEEKTKSLQNLWCYNYPTLVGQEK